MSYESPPIEAVWPRTGPCADQLTAYYPPSELFHDSVEAVPAEPKVEAIVFKTVERCNLACGYCYEPLDGPVMAYDVIERTANEAAQFAHDRQEPVQIIIHGGEPLLTHKVDEPVAYYRKFMQILRESAAGVLQSNGIEDPNDADIKQIFSGVGIQTNATLLTPEIVELFKEHGIQVSCSLDGGPEANSRRLTRGGRESYTETKAGIELLEELYPAGFSSILAVANPDTDPVEVYNELKKYERPLDFLLPYVTHDNPPAQDEIERLTSWYLGVYNAWLDDTLHGRNPPSIRTFQSIIRLNNGQSSQTEALGPSWSNAVFVRADGSVHGLDALEKVDPIRLLPSEPDVGDMSNNRFKAAEYMLARRGLIGAKSLPTACQGCSIRDICHGGHLANRYSSRTGIDNPSVYCSLLKELIGRVVIDNQDAGSIFTAHGRFQSEGIPPRKAYVPKRPAGVASLATNFRAAQLSDLPDIVGIWQGGFAEEYTDAWSIPPDGDRRLALQGMHNFLRQRAVARGQEWGETILDPDPLRHLIVAERAKYILGFVSLAGGWEGLRGWPIVDGSYCAPGMPAGPVQRLHAALMSEAADYANRLGGVGICLQEAPKTRTDRLATYADLGFRAAPKTSLPLPPAAIDTELMMLDFAA